MNCFFCKQGIEYLNHNNIYHIYDNYVCNNHKDIPVEYFYFDCNSRFDSFPDTKDARLTTALFSVNNMEVYMYYYSNGLKRTTVYCKDAVLFQLKQHIFTPENAGRLIKKYIIFS
jgi:hypothetical protein